VNPVNDLKSIINDAFEKRADITPLSADTLVRDAVDEIINQLDHGTIRVAEKIDSDWQVNHWITKAVLLSFRFSNNDFMKGGFTNYYDKVPSKYADYNTRDFRSDHVRVVPPASARRGAYIAPSCILMPAYINIGAYIDSGTMIDTWSTIGSCAQIGQNVHISGNVEIGGMLDPLQASPTIIEDNCFIGSHSNIVEGVIVETGCVISMGVHISQSTRIYNRQTKEIIYGRVPAGSVVVPGNLPADDGSHSLYCAVIVKQVDEKTRSRTSINELLRDI